MKKIYVDGQLRGYEDVGSGMYLDHPELPGRRCAYISYPRGHSFIGLLEQGNSVRTSGHTFSLHAPETQATPVENGKNAENAPQNDIPDMDTPSAWDEIPRCLGYAIGAIMASGFMGGMLGYVWYTFTH